MKYHYKSPEQLQKEIQEHITRHKTNPYSKIHLLIFLNILIIVFVIFLLDKTGFFRNADTEKKIEKVSYKIVENKIVLKFYTKEDVSHATEHPFRITLQELILHYKEEEQEYLSKIPSPVQNITLSSNPTVIVITLPEHFFSNRIIMIEASINGKIYHLQKEE